MTHDARPAQRVFNGRPNDRAKPKRGPESDFWDLLKGQKTQIEFDDNSTITATLLWVDRYTIGIRCSDGREQMIYKSILAKVERARDGNANSDTKRFTGGNGNPGTTPR